MFERRRGKVIVRLPILKENMKVNKKMNIMHINV